MCTLQASAFYGAALKIRPIIDGTITIDSSIAAGKSRARFVLSRAVVVDADLIIIMTARPVPNSEEGAGWLRGVCH